MNPENREKVRRLMDFIYDACRFDSQGQPRPVSEKMNEYSRYIGWLEGNLMSVLTDEQAERFVSRVNLGVYDHAADEALLYDDEDGSFY